MESMRMSRSEKGDRLCMFIFGLDGQVYRGTMGAEPSFLAGNGI